VFPGKHHRAKFDVKESNKDYHVAFSSSDGTTVSVDATLATSLNPESIFENMDDASAFFKAGAAGYSPNGNKYDGLLLNTYKWEMRPLNVSKVSSSYFSNEAVFPKGSVVFDNALLMTGIEHEWSSLADKCAG
jgi:hypothetical protein